MQNEVFSLKMTVVCLSFSKRQLAKVNMKLNILFGSLKEGSRVSEPSSRENFYPWKLPTELYWALIKRMTKTELSKDDCLINMLTETVFREGDPPETQYEFLKRKYGSKTLLEKVLENRKPEPSTTIEVNFARLKVQQSKVSVRRRVRSLLSEAVHSQAERFEKLTKPGIGAEK
ncbi:MAG: hypothetical protein ACUVT9_07510 [Candidatus Bathycorpusculaceae bacterium]